MKNLFNKLKTKFIPDPIPVPDRWPNFNNIDEWMEEQVDYYSKVYPNNMDRLFDPSSGDYMAKNVSVGTSHKSLMEHIEHYREIKSRYPEAVEKARKNFLYYSYYREGDPEDYPKDL